MIAISNVSRSKTYGYSPRNPVKLGISNFQISLTYPYKYLNSLAGPNGEPLVFKRIKSCCPFKTVNSQIYPYQNLGVLEIYEIEYSGLDNPVRIYINFFDQGEILAPKGFTVKSLKN